MEDFERRVVKMEVYLEEPEKINEYNLETSPNISTRTTRSTRYSRKCTRKSVTKDDISDEFSEEEQSNTDNSNMRKRINLLEMQLKACKCELNEMRDENLALRENNVQYQVEIFKLRRQHTNLNGQEPKISFLQRYQEILNTQSQEIAKTDRLVSRKKRLAEIKSEEIIKKELAEKKRLFKTNENIVDDAGNPIELTDSDIEELADVEPTIKGDPKFISKLLVMLFDANTLMNSSVTGGTTRNYKQLKRDSMPLDSNKLLYIRQLFTKRLKKEGLRRDERKDREKLVNGHVNHKICNMRKCDLNKQKKLLKLEEDAAMEDPFFA